MIPEPASAFVTAQDGLKLHVRAFGPRGATRLPVVCLPGLSRTTEDFETLAAALAGAATRPRRVLALDYRGRGRSGYDRNSANYSLPVELNDLKSVLTACEAEPAVFIGSSRGGILTMLLAAQYPAVIAGAILNDIGPVIEPRGLMRIKGYVGKIPRPATFEEGAEILRRLFGNQFPKLDTPAWLVAARHMWRQDNKRLVPTYDVRLAKTLKGIDPEHPLPPLWNQFDALSHVPVMVIRGENSDILSAETVEAMRARRNLDSIEVADQGHTPLLVEPDIIERIAAFVETCDRASGRK